eukprot:353495-Pleurochrysis_carterae.AAC.3
MRAAGQRRSELSPPFVKCRCEIFALVHNAPPSSHASVFHSHGELDARFRKTSQPTCIFFTMRLSLKRIVGVATMYRSAVCPCNIPYHMRISWAQESGLKPDVVSYNAAMSAASQVEKALARTFACRKRSCVCM